MKHLYTCRRTFLSFVGVMILGILGFYTKSADVSMAIATITVGLAGANAYQGLKNKE